MGTAEPVKVYSDHSNLIYFRSAKYLTPKQARWAAFLDSFNFVIHHIAGKSNPADGPSRRPDLLEGQPEIFQSRTIANKLHEDSIDDIGSSEDDEILARHDIYFQRPTDELIDYLKKYYQKLSEEEKESLTESGGLFWHKDRIYVPHDQRTRILQLSHDSPVSGHPGIARTLSLVTRSFSWPGIRRDVISFVKTCDSCQRVKAHRQLQEGQLNSLSIPDKPWSVIGMDFITKLPVSSGFDSIMVVVDLLSKMTHFIPCKETYSASRIAQLFRSNIFRLHGLPEKIISDRGSVFISEFWKSLMNSLQIKAGYSTAYHPQTDGQTERMNQVLEDYLRHFCSYYQDNWDKLLDLAEFATNNLDSSSSGVSPFFFCQGYHPKCGVLTNSSRPKTLDEFIEDLQVTQEQAAECLEQAKKRQARYYNIHKRPATQYTAGDQVLLLRKFIQTRRFNSKLDYRFLGPFRVIEMVGKNAVRLDLTKDYPKLHPVFNVSLVTKYRSPSEVAGRSILEGIREEYYTSGRIVDWSHLSSVLDARKVKGKYEYLLRWHNSTPGEDTWVSEQHIPSRLQGYVEKFREELEKTYKKKVKGP
ncbi:hypothetical protein Pst134EA_033175 [Puccinia striiformis f. sp. tritici]|uniref:hypothetical protein n=1 Tax=Puccinia striiformis f. sp. tritici TaxID=168172 RepID=UPI0020079E8D|nr:hypothetical protein Pst134EA_033175 [Puccinia striiformis f. sp. tritici]KAH9448947.1 hypothetical protein Pst134EA_033175 [Puccinia striiformis f. sp. tritici]